MGSLKEYSPKMGNLTILLCLVVATSCGITGCPPSGASTQQCGGAFCTASSDESCNGSLKMHISDTEVDIFKSRNGSLGYEVVERVVNKGNCCWKILKTKDGRVKVATFIWGTTANHLLYHLQCGKQNAR